MISAGEPKADCKATRKAQFKYFVIPNLNT